MSYEWLEIFFFSLQDLNEQKTCISEAMFSKKKKAYAPKWQSPVRVGRGEMAQTTGQRRKKLLRKSLWAIKEVRTQKMQRPNNPLRTTEASKFPLEVLRVGLGESGKVTQREEREERQQQRASGGCRRNLEAHWQTPGQWRHQAQRWPEPHLPLYSNCLQDTGADTGLRDCRHSGKEKCKTQEGGKCLFRRGLSLASEVSDHVLQQPPGLWQRFREMRQPKCKSRRKRNSAVAWENKLSHAESDKAEL